MQVLASGRPEEQFVQTLHFGVGGGHDEHLLALADAFQLVAHPAELTAEPLHRFQMRSRQTIPQSPAARAAAVAKGKTLNFAITASSAHQRQRAARAELR